MAATVLMLFIFQLILAFFYREMHRDGPALRRVEEEMSVLVVG